MSSWTQPAWRAEADDWIAGQLERLDLTATGAPDQFHIRAWSTVIRLPTDAGDVYFKANEPALRHEAALVERLAERCPELVPALLALDRKRGWMLMKDAGTRLRELIVTNDDQRHWLAVLPSYAGLQIDFGDDADELVAIGVPDLRLATLPTRFEALLAVLDGLGADERRRLVRAVSEVADLCSGLAAFGVPETIQHDDLHDGQVFVRDGRYSLLDWGDACVSHPFFSLSVTLDGGIAWGVDDVERSVETTPFQASYLEPFVRAVGGDGLMEACAIARRLGWACRAVNGHLDYDPAQTYVRLRMFLDGRP